MKTKLTTLLIASLLLLPSCASKTTKPASMGIVNSKCPIVPSHTASDKTVVQHEGKQVGLCCAGCLSTWDKLSDAEKSAKVKAAM